MGVHSRLEVPLKYMVNIAKVICVRKVDWEQGSGISKEYCIPVSFQVVLTEKNQEFLKS